MHVLSGYRWMLTACLLLLAVLSASAQSTPGIDLSMRFADAQGEADLSIAIQLVILMTLLSLAPAIVMLMTSFMRIIIVLGFLRNALGLQSTPPNQVLVGMAFFLSFFLMMPVGERMMAEAVEPYRAGEVTSLEALELASKPLAAFMLKQTRPADIEFFLSVAGMQPLTVDELPMRIIIPAFLMSELRTAFQMGFLIFLPFLVVDFVIATVLMGMGMMMMPPVIVSLPFKILLFVMVDGWYLIIRSLVVSF